MVAATVDHDQQEVDLDRIHKPEHHIHDGDQKRGVSMAKNTKAEANKRLSDK